MSCSNAAEQPDLVQDFIPRLLLQSAAINIAAGSGLLCPLQLFCRLPGLVPVVGDEHFRALRCKDLGRGRANTVVGIADQDDTVLELGANHLFGYIAYLI
jgi:hypothetical protein